MAVIVHDSDNASGSMADVSIANSAGNFHYVIKGTSSAVGQVIDAEPMSDNFVLTTTFSSLPIISRSELAQEYKELGAALAEMTALDEGEELQIERPVFEAASSIAFELMKRSFPPPEVFTHGPKSVVFDWSNARNNLYLTISADKMSALISTPERIKRRMEYSLKEFLNPSGIFLAIRAAYAEQPVALIEKAGSSPTEEPSAAVG